MVVLETATKPLRFARKVHNPVRLPCETTSERPKVARDRQFLTLFTSKCRSRHNGVHFLNVASPKSVPRLSFFCIFDFEMCLAPQRRALFRHLNFQKCSERGVFYILTSKCASRNNGVHFLNIATSKSGPNMVCFVHFDFQMCFVPQGRALFRQLNFQSVRT